MKHFEKMLLQEFTDILEREPARRDRPVVVVNEDSGELSRELTRQGFQVRVVQDSATRLSHVPEELPCSPDLTPEILQGASTVLYRLPRPLAALEETASRIAAMGDPDVLFLGAARVKDLNHTMNQVLANFFDDVRASRGAFKSRALVASTPVQNLPVTFPKEHTAQILGTTLHLRAYGLTFGGARLDPGTRFLLETLGQNQEHRDILNHATTLIDLGSGNGTVTATLAQTLSDNAERRFLATDDSYAAAKATEATLTATLGSDAAVHSQIRVLHQDALVDVADDSAHAIVLNPPFHDGDSGVTSDIALHLFAEAARVLQPGGHLYTVWNSARRYRSALESHVGVTEELARNSRFTVTVSTV